MEGIATKAVLLSSWSTILLLLLWLTRSIYRLYLHPLRKFAGPPLWAISHIPLHYYTVSGRIDWVIQDLHAEYGPIIRIAPDELSFATEEAYRDIYGHRSGRPLIKDPAFFSVVGQTRNLFNAGEGAHTRLRKQLLKPLSEKALREQAPLIGHTIDLLMDKLHSFADSGQPVDLTKWYNYWSFDIAGELILGKSFDCMKSQVYHKWVGDILGNVRMGPYLRAFGQYLNTKKLLPILSPASLREARKKHIGYVTDATSERLAKGHEYDKKDFMSYILDKENELTFEELAANANILLVAASETTPTVLSTLTYYLLRRPETLVKATAEIRLAFPSEEEINIVNINARAPYLHACLSEAMRIRPPGAGRFPRRTPTDTSILVAGQVVPAWTNVNVHQLSIASSARYFHDPELFAPERWFPETRTDAESPFKDDVLSASQPFLLGPRDCMGRTLAWNDMKLVVTRLLWNFELDLCEESANWNTEMTTYSFWQRPPLWIGLKAAR